MSLKPVELQIAIPRTQDAGTMQSQMQQKQLTEQVQLANDASKATEEDRKRNAKLNEASHSQIRPDEEKSNHEQGRQPADKRNRSESGENGKKAEHPYKGQHIDISL